MILRRVPEPYRAPLIVLAVLAAAVAAVAAVAVRTAPVRDSVRVYTQLLGAANRQDVEAARRLCSTRYASGHPLLPAAEGGLVGLPRNIHKNFQAWRDGPDVLLCPTNRIGPVYRFVHEPDGWRFDGPVGLLMGNGQVVRSVDVDPTQPTPTAPDLE
jgi:hypothetical protein